jgi:ArsR family transcriptional regulator, arsenate/arsenite/antimonite-responsive transcriptional repressor
MALNDSASVAARALAHPVRVRLLQLLATQSECRGSEIFSEIPLAQSTISEHLRVLKEAGLVNAHAVGTGMVYCIDASPLEPLAQLLEELRREISVCAPGDGKNS